MVDVYTTEEEQIEAIKKWWRENWKSLAGGVLLGLAILLGFRTYSNNRDVELGMAAYEFDAMMQAIASDKKDEAAAHAEILNSKFATTPFAVTAALAQAKLKVEKKDLLAAESFLKWALDHAKNEALKHAARLRLARVLLASNKANDALALISLSSQETAGYTASYEELKGDIYVASGKVSDAISSYNLALAAMEPSDRARQNLQMKLNDLGAIENAKQAS